MTHNEDINDLINRADIYKDDPFYAAKILEALKRKGIDVSVPAAFNFLSRFTFDCNSFCENLKSQLNSFVPDGYKFTIIYFAGCCEIYPSHARKDYYFRVFFSGNDHTYFSIRETIDTNGDKRLHYLASTHDKTTIDLNEPDLFFSIAYHFVRGPTYGHRKLIIDREIITEEIINKHKERLAATLEKNKNKGWIQKLKSPDRKRPEHFPDSLCL